METAKVNREAFELACEFRLRYPEEHVPLGEFCAKAASSFTAPAAQEKEAQLALVGGGSLWSGTAEVGKPLPLLGYGLKEALDYALQLENRTIYTLFPNKYPPEEHAVRVGSEKIRRLSIRIRRLDKRNRKFLSYFMEGLVLDELDLREAEGLLTRQLLAGEHNVSAGVLRLGKAYMKHSTIYGHSIARGKFDMLDIRGTNASAMVELIDELHLSNLQALDLRGKSLSDGDAEYVSRALPDSLVYLGVTTDTERGAAAFVERGTARALHLEGKWTSSALDVTQCFDYVASYATDTLTEREQSPRFPPTSSILGQALLKSRRLCVLRLGDTIACSRGGDTIASKLLQSLQQLVHEVPQLQRVVGPVVPKESRKEEEDEKKKGGEEEEKDTQREGTAAAPTTSMETAAATEAEEEGTWSEEEIRQTLSGLGLQDRLVEKFFREGYRPLTSLYDACELAKNLVWAEYDQLRRSGYFGAGDIDLKAGLIAIGIREDDAYYWARENLTDDAELMALFQHHGLDNIAFDIINANSGISTESYSEQSDDDDDEDDDEDLYKDDDEPQDGQSGRGSGSAGASQRSGLSAGGGTSSSPGRSGGTGAGDNGSSREGSSGAEGGNREEGPIEDEAPEPVVITLYHGTDLTTACKCREGKIPLKRRDHKTDFAPARTPAFYLGNNESLAQKWAVKNYSNAPAYLTFQVNCTEWFRGLNVLRFDQPNNEWKQFVFSHRLTTATTGAAQYDVIIGPVLANPGAQSADNAVEMPGGFIQYAVLTTKAARRLKSQCDPEIRTLQWALYSGPTHAEALRGRGARQALQQRRSHAGRGAAQRPPLSDAHRPPAPAGRHAAHQTRPRAGAHAGQARGRAPAGRAHDEVPLVKA